MEVWKDIPGYEGLYQVSDMGRIKRIAGYKKRNKWGSYTILPEKYMKSSFDKDGYLRIGLAKDRERKTYHVHRLVALAFLPNPNNYPQINHKDENKQNNAVDNLEWCTCSYNINYGTRNDKIASKYNKKKRTGADPNSKFARKVAQYDLAGNLIRVWASISLVEQELGANHSSIIQNCQGKRKMVYGYKWAYVS